jgi:hypothetical protein
VDSFEIYVYSKEEVYALLGGRLKSFLTFRMRTNRAGVVPSTWCSGEEWYQPHKLSPPLPASQRHTATLEGRAIGEQSALAIRYERNWHSMITLSLPVITEVVLEVP